jgi:DNA-binding CsgD family transcriptional regulator
VTLSRFSGAFTDRQVDLLGSCHPHLRAAVARSRRDDHVALQIAPTPMWVPAHSAPGIATPAGGKTDDRPEVTLSDRELQVLALVAQGLTDAQTARRLQLSPATVSKHLSRIYRRAGVPNRAAAAELWSRTAGR